VDAKVAALQATGTLNRRPQAVTDPLFRTGSFFDPRDLLQVRYEMVRRHLVEEEPVAVTAQVFGVSLPTAYQAHIAFKAYGTCSSSLPVDSPLGIETERVSGERLKRCPHHLSTLW
jgi:hypothetical protein